MMEDEYSGIIWCYSCKHRYYFDAKGENPYCERNCGDDWHGYESDDDEEDEG